MDAIDDAKARARSAQADADQACKRLRAARRELFEATEAHEDAQIALLAAERAEHAARRDASGRASVDLYPLAFGSPNAGVRRARG